MVLSHLKLLSSTKRKIVGGYVKPSIGIRDIPLMKGVWVFTMTKT